MIFDWEDNQQGHIEQKIKASLLSTVLAKLSEMWNAWCSLGEASNIAAPVQYNVAIRSELIRKVTCRILGILGNLCC